LGVDEIIAVDYMCMCKDNNYVYELNFELKERRMGILIIPNKVIFFLTLHDNVVLITKQTGHVVECSSVLCGVAVAVDRVISDEILQKIKESGFVVAMQKEVRLSPEQAAEFYKEHEGQPYYQDLVDRMSR